MKKSPSSIGESRPPEPRAFPAAATESNTQVPDPAPTQASQVESLESRRIPSFLHFDQETVLRCQMRLMKYCVNNDRDVCSDDVPRHLPGHVWPQVGSATNRVAMMQKLADRGHWRRLPKRSKVDVLHPRAFHRD